MSDKEEIAFREMFPLVIGALIALAVLLLIVSLIIDTGDDVYVPAGMTRTEVLMERLSPVGEVQFGGPEEVAEAEPAADEPAEPRSGSEVYGAVCSACHDTGAAGAPTLDAGDDWSNRLGDAGFDGLLDSVINGKGAMPPRAGAGGDITDEELENGIEFILDEAGVSR